MARRAHSKIAELPDALKAVVHDLLLSGKTYDEITQFLRENGEEIGRSSVGRYGKSFHDRLAKLTEVRDQAKTIVEELSGRPATEMHEAANQLAIQQIFERLLDAKDDIDNANIVKLINAVGWLQRSAVSNERAKLAFKRQADAAAKDIDKIGKKAGLSEETLREIRERVYGIVD